LNKGNYERANISENFSEREDEATLLLACQSEENNHQEVWYINTGCSNHMCGTISSFSVIDKSFRTTVRFGDDSAISVMGNATSNFAIKMAPSKPYPTFSTSQI
jgi:hypothetical protein